MTLRSYRIRILGIALLLTAYVGVAHHRPLVKDQEFFPFFNWGLFSISSDLMEDKVLLIKIIDGKEMGSTRPIHELKEYFPKAHNIDLSKAVDRLFSALVRGDEAQFQNIKKIIEDRYMEGHSEVTYDLAQILYNPSERYADRKQFTANVLREMEK